MTVVGGHAELAASRSDHVFGEEGGKLGRSRACDWILQDAQKYLSGVHAEIRFVDGQFYLVDRSTNGTFLNGSACRMELNCPIALRTGDRLGLGDLQIEVELLEDTVGTARSAGLGQPLAADSAQPCAVGPGSVQQPPAPAALLRHLEQLMGLPAGGVSERDGLEFLENLAGIARESVAGLVEALESRARIKADFHSATTQLRFSENNPLKFSPTGREALYKLLIERHGAYLRPAEAVREGFADLGLHERGMLAGAKAALAALAYRLDPVAFERRVGQSHRGLRWLARQRVWRRYKEFYDALIGPSPEDVYQVFGETFARHYDEVQRGKLL